MEPPPPGDGFDDRLDHLAETSDDVDDPSIPDRLCPITELADGVEECWHELDPDERSLFDRDEAEDALGALAHERFEDEYTDEEIDRAVAHIVDVNLDWDQMTEPQHLTERRRHWQDGMPGWLQNLTSLLVLVGVLVVLFLMWTWYATFWYLLSWLFTWIADVVTDALMQ